MARINRTRLIVAVAAVSAIVVVGTAVVAAGGAKGHSLADARRATAQYHRVDRAVAAGYALFADAEGIACIDNPPLGAMGIHYVSSIVGDAILEPTTPEALVYVPDKHDRLRLGALEYIVFKDVWERAHGLGAAPPRLFGREFGLVPFPNRFGIGAFYELHVWLWKHNPSGMFFEWNPRVTC